MKRTRQILTLLLLLLPAMLLARSGRRNDMLVFHDETMGSDSALVDVYLDLRHLYTDSLLVGFALRDKDGLVDTGSLRWLTQDQLSFFRYNNHLYAPLSLTEGDATHTYFMRHYRDRKSRVKVYTMGKGRQREYYALYPDSSVQRIPDMVEFRDQERLERTGNRNFIRGLHGGVLAGMMANGPVTIGDYYPESEAQQAVTAGVWMDWPLWRHGASLHVKAQYHAMSAQTQRHGVAWAYNRRGIDLPVTFRYTSLQVPFRVIPFVECGLNCRLALQNSLEGMANLYGERPDGLSYPTGELVRMEQRNTAMALSPVLGGGLRYRISDTRHAMLTFDYYFHSVMSDYGYGVNSAAMYYIRKVSAQGWALTLAVGLW